MGRLPQHFDACTEVDVIGGSGDDEGGDGFDSGGLGFSDATLGSAEVDDFDIEAAGVERGGDVLFGGDADGAACVVEYGFGFHVNVVCLWFCSPLADCV